MVLIALKKIQLNKVRAIFYLTQVAVSFTRPLVRIFGERITAGAVQKGVVSHPFIIDSTSR